MAWRRVVFGISGFVAALCGVVGCRTEVDAVLFGPSQVVRERPGPVASATPSPTVPTTLAPSPEPAATPADGPDCIHDNDHPVERVNLGVYFVECGGEPVPGSTGSRSMPVGCRLHLNATPRDGSNQPTCSREWPTWSVNDPDLVGGGGGATFTPTYTALSPGVLRIECSVDGVGSNPVVVELH